MIQGQLMNSFAQPNGGSAPAGAQGSASPLSAGYGGGGQSDSYIPSYGGGAPASADSSDMKQQMFGIISLVLQLLTTILPQIAGGDQKAVAGTPGGYGATPGGYGGTPAAGGYGNDIGPNAPPQLQKYGKEIANASAETGVPANVLGAMMWQESRGNVNGQGNIGEVGLMQVTPDTYKDLQAKHPELQGDLADPQTNIMASAYYMKDLMQQFGDIPTALRAYNSGPNGVDVNNLNALPAGTGDATYVDKVMGFAGSLSKGAALPA